jgi:hypothetical protein
MKRKNHSKKKSVKKIVAPKKILQPVQILVLGVIVVAVVFFTNKMLNPPSVEELAGTNSYENLTPYIIGQPGSTHYHSTFLIYINGQLRRFDDAKSFQASPYAHIHDYSFAEIHTHASNVSLGFFFDTIGINFNATCLVFGTDESYCSNSTHTLKFYVEGQPSYAYGRKLTMDWEHYLITYGKEIPEEIEEQIKTVPDPLASPPPSGRTGYIYSPDYEPL